MSIGDGLGWRLLLFVLAMSAMILYTVRYANRVQADPTSSIVGIDPADAELARHAGQDELEALSTRHQVIIGLVVFTFLLLTFSIVPWGAILNNTAADPLTHETIVNPFAWELGWWLPELSVMFLVMAVVVGAVGRLGEAATARAFMRGIADFVGPAVLVVLARGVSVIMNNTKTIDTVLNAMEGLVEGTSNVVFILLMYLVNLPLAFLIGSPSGNAVLTMPILAPAGGFLGRRPLARDHRVERRGPLVRARPADQRHPPRRPRPGAGRLRPVSAASCCRYGASCWCSSWSSC